MTSNFTFKGNTVSNSSLFRDVRDNFGVDYIFHIELDNLKTSKLILIEGNTFESNEIKSLIFLKVKFGLKPTKF